VQPPPEARAEKSKRSQAKMTARSIGISKCGTTLRVSHKGPSRVNVYNGLISLFSDS
jgi:hypothetical protein